METRMGCRKGGFSNASVRNKARFHSEEKKKKKNRKTRGNRTATSSAVETQMGSLENRSAQTDKTKIKIQEKKAGKRKAMKNMW